MDDALLDSRGSTTVCETRLWAMRGFSLHFPDVIKDIETVLMEDNDNFSLDEDFPLGDGVADMEAIVTCPYCGEEVEISVDPGGGSSQSYVEDCAVCCSPWLVHVQYAGGQVQVSVAQTDA